MRHGAGRGITAVMISIVIPTLNAAQTLPSCFAALLPATVDGLVRQVVVTDGGSSDATLAIAEDAGADIVSGAVGRGAQLARGADAAKADWLLFLHADTVLQPGWEDAAAAFIERGSPNAAGYFRFRLDEVGLAARAVALGVASRCRFVRLPYGDQGLLISRALYDELGGYRPLPIMEDVDLVERIRQAGRLLPLGASAVTSAARYRRDGYAARVWRNWRCIAAWKRGVAPEKIAAMYRGRKEESE